MKPIRDMKKIITNIILFALVILATSQVSPGNGDKPYVDGEIMVKISPSFATDQPMVIQALEEDFRFIRLAFQHKISGRLGILLFRFTPEILPDEDVLREFRRHPMVEIAQFNHFVQLRETIPSDQYFNEQWNMRNTGQNGGVADADIDATNAWDIATGNVTALGETIVIADVDDGFDIDHEDLMFWVNSQEIPSNGIDDDQNGYIDDYLGWSAYTHSGNITQADHGTHTAGISSSKGDNDKGVAGVTWNTKIMAVQANSTIESVVIEGYGYVYEMRKRYNESNGATGAFVVSTNSSFGVDMGQPEDYPLWGAMYDSMGAEGILSSAATANANWDIDMVGDIPTAFPNESLISVTNTDNKDVKNFSAAYGLTTIDLGAPGTAIYSTRQNNNYGLKTGCSMAAPHLAGAVALMWAAAPEDHLLAYRQDPAGMALVIKQYLLNGVDELPSLQGKCVSGGRLNVYKSIQLMRNPIMSPSPLSIYLPILPNDLDTVDVTLNSFHASAINYLMTFPDTIHWLGLSKDNGTITGYGSDSFKVYINSEGLNYGYYSTYVTIKYADTLKYMLPVGIEVIPNVGITERIDNPEVLNLRAYPNPASDRLTISFYNRKASTIELSVINPGGQQVSVVHSGYLSAGGHEFTWNTASDDGTPVPNGIYILKLTNGSGSISTKILVTR